MKFLVRLADELGFVRDVSISCDITATIGDAALALRHPGDMREQTRANRVTKQGPWTLVGESPSGAGRLLLDPMTPLATSGLQSGWQVTVVREFASAAPRARQMRGTVEVLTGSQQGARFSLVRGENTIGRDRRSRVRIDDRSVSRQHAVIDATEHLVLRDLGSANGTRVEGAAAQSVSLARTSEVTVGSVSFRIVPLSDGIPRESIPVAPWHMHTRAPQLARTVTRVEHQLPRPPSPSEPARLPLIAMLAPMAMGVAMFTVTQSPMSLMMVAFTPMMMVGSWLDQRLSGRKRRARELERFRQTLVRERDELRTLQARERTERTHEAAGLDQLAQAVESRNEVLWSKRSTDAAVLEIRLGEGAVQSNISVQLPERHDAAPEEWEMLKEVATEIAQIGPVPVTVRLGESGSLAIVGEMPHAASIARAVLVQVASLYSPADVVIAVIAADAHRGGSWQWAKWLPHVAQQPSPITFWPLADTFAAALQLISECEQLVEQRRAAAQHARVQHGVARERSVVMLVLDEGLEHEIRARLITLAESGHTSGVHLVWVASHRSRVPAACRTTVEWCGDDSTARVWNSNQGRQVTLQCVEMLDEQRTEQLARLLAPVRDASVMSSAAQDLPSLVRFRDLHAGDVLESSDSIVHRWRSNGTLMAEWRDGEVREAIRLAAGVGQGSDGLVTLDLRAHGPHALVGGTSGSGKSEFLQTWIMSLAVNLSPDRMSLLLVDYKGGAAFAECAELPHTVGLVTDLTPTLATRVLASLRAELRHREQVLARHGAKDLSDMERRSDPAAPPALIIVIDEFATLVAEIPEFVDGVIDIAQRGRSLGLHLIMATQRPSGVIRENLRANTNLRIALRMADAADSNDVVGVNDAALFDPQIPGRAMMTFGAGRAQPFQSGYLGEADEGQPAVGLEVRTIAFAEGEPWHDVGQASAGIPNEVSSSAHPRDIERVRDQVLAAARSARLSAPRRPWLDPLPLVLPLVTVGMQGSAHGEATPTGIPLGLADRPDEHTQPAVIIDFDDLGNIAFIGASGTGKTSALVTLAAALSSRADGDPVHIFAIDSASGALGGLLQLPTVGAVAMAHDTELRGRVMRHVAAVVQRRTGAFGAVGAAHLAAYRNAVASTEPRVVLLIDGFHVLRHASEQRRGRDTFIEDLTAIAQGGRSVGVHVVLTTDRSAAVPASLGATVQAQFAFRSASATEAAFLGISSDRLRDAEAGRAVRVETGDEVQIAVLGTSADLSDQLTEVTALGQRLRAQGCVPIPRVRNAPERLTLEEVPGESDGLPVIGLDTIDLAPMGLPTAGLAVISGPPGSGVSTTLVAAVAAVSRWAVNRQEKVTRVLFTLAVDAVGGTSRRLQWDHVARGAAEIVRSWNELGALLDPLRAAAEACSIANRRLVIVVEQSADAAGTEAMPVLTQIAALARRSQALVLFDCDPGRASGVWELFSVLRHPNWGIALRPDEADTGSPFREVFAGASRGDFGPGQGIAVIGGRAIPLQVAIAEPASPH